MKILMPSKLQALAGCALAAVLMGGLALAVSPPSEPVWKGHRLSQWLDAYDSNLRFNPGHGLRSRFSDEEIDAAIEGIGPAALPCLRRWLMAKPSRLKPWLNQCLNRQNWIRFRLSEDRDLRIVAETGFMVYGTQAQPLLPELVRLSRNPDPETRGLAYEAAFFTRPDKEIFLPLAYRALNENDKGIQAMAAQWMAERFPADAEKAGLRSRFPEYFENEPVISVGPPVQKMTRE